MTLEYSLERTILIRATRETVFRFFTDSERFASWWGQGSHIEPRPGGTVRIVYSGGVVALGQVVDITAPERIVFTYGYEDPAKPIRPGGSRVTVTFAEESSGTLVTLVHELPDAVTRDMHVPGWRFQLSLFANVAADAQNAAVAERIHAWFRAWNGDGELEVTDDVTFRDAYAAISGREELALHIAAARQHMPMTLRPEGEPRHCQGSVLCDWSASRADGTRTVIVARGTNHFELSKEGRIRAVTGFWARSTAPS